jgi:glutamate-1-semialdehyde 2,1-aminomutase
MFTNSGSEAVHLACRAARAYTGRGRIAKMAAGFDGWFDDVSFGNVTSAEACFETGARPATQRTTLIRFNDFDDVERLFAEDQDIAAVILEPMLANAGCIMPLPGYLKHVQDIAHKHGALVICDEVGLDPDLASVGKAIGNGVPVSAVVGKPHILAGFAEGRVARGGTFSGNPMACAAVSSTLSLLDECDYERLIQRGNDLREAIEAIFESHNVTISTSGYGNVFGIWLAPAAPTTYDRAAQIANPEFTKALHLALREEGVLMMPSPYGRIYISFEHSQIVIEEMKVAFEKAAGKLSRQFGNA